MDQQLITNLAVIAIVYFLVFLPRFNQWPQGYGSKFSGHPSGYISDLTFLFFSLAYLSTFIFLGFALSQIPNFQRFYPALIESGVPGIDFTLLNSNFAVALVFLVTALSIPVVDNADHRWRGYLLNLARIPRDALALKTGIIDSLEGLDHGAIYTRYLSREFRNHEQAEFWARCLDEPTSEAHALATATLSGLNIIDRIRDLSPKSQDLEYLAGHEKRLKEISAIIPTLSRTGNELSPAPYREELETRLSHLAEIYACYAVKRFPNHAQRYRALNEAGFPVHHPDRKTSKLFVPVLITGSVLLACCAVVTMLGLILFDAMNLPGPERWFEMNRVYAWTSGAWISFVMAFGFGIFFNEILEPTLGSRSLMAYMLAFVFSTLSACAFFLFARTSFQPHYIWLAINFGLLSAVTIATLKRNVAGQGDVLRLSSRLAVYYGLASLVFSTLVHLHAGGWALDLNNMLTAAAFGLFRGLVIGFFVAYVFIDFGRAHQQLDQRRTERLPVGRKVRVACRGTELPAYLRNLSDHGALVKVFSWPLAVGDELSLMLSKDRPSKGVVQWVDGNLAGLRFEAEGQSRGKAA